MKKHGIYIDPSAARQADRMLSQIEAQARGAAIDRVLRDAGNLLKKTVREILPKPGYPGDKEGLKPLRDTVTVKVKNYQGGFFKVLIVGYALPAGAHGHLVEFGHEKVLWGEPIEGSPVEGKGYFTTAVQMAQPQISTTILAGARREAEKVRPGAAAA
jgi:hypothetical protein